MLFVFKKTKLINTKKKKKKNENAFSCKHTHKILPNRKKRKLRKRKAAARRKTVVMYKCNQAFNFDNIANVMLQIKAVVTALTWLALIADLASMYNIK